MKTNKVFNIFIFILFSFNLNATHFRYGNINWTRTAGTNKVNFKITVAWRYDLADDITFYYGDGQSFSNARGIEIYNVPNEYRVFQINAEHTYSTNGTFVAYLQGCCRIIDVENGSNEPFVVSTVVCFNDRNLNSPQYEPSAPIILEMNPFGNNKFQLNFLASTNSNLIYSTTSLKGKAYIPAIGNNFAHISTNGLIEWDTRGTSEGEKYIMKISVSDGCAVVELDFLIKIVGPPKLISCFNFNGNANDDVGTNHGVVNGATLVTDRFGNENSAYEFSGYHNNIVIPTTNLLLNKYTYSAWVNFNNFSSGYCDNDILSIGDIFGSQAISVGACGTKHWLYKSATGFITQYYTIPYASYELTNFDTWHFMVATRTLDSLKLYVDGKLLGKAGTYKLTPYYGTNTASIGSQGNINYFKGKIDDIKIFDNVLTDEDIKILYNSEKSNCDSPCNGMIYSIKSGNWSDIETWSCGRVPNDSDVVLIRSDHIINVFDDNSLARKLILNGQINFESSNSRIIFGN